MASRIPLEVRLILTKKDAIFMLLWNVVHLIDAGMHNNLPLDPWIRPHRPCDIQIQLDASSDVQTGAALQRINEWAQDKGCEFVPRIKLTPLDPWPTEKDKEGKDQRKKLN